MAASDNLTDFLREHRAFARGLTPAIVGGCDAAGRELVEFARSKTNEMRPPVRAGEGERAAHPGRWADRTSNLANAYGSDAGTENGVPYCEVSNQMEYAKHLDEMDDYWVLTGLETGGHAEAAVTKWVKDSVEAHEARHSNPGAS